MSFEVCYTSCACNQTPTAVSWGKNNLICYASSNSVRVYDPMWGSGGKVITSLYGHTKRVNSVKWISGVDYETEIVSGSSDGTAVVWSYRDKSYASFILKGHEDSVNIVDGLYKQSNKRFAVVVTASVDCSMKIWRRDDIKDGFTVLQSLNQDFICTGLALALMPKLDTIILACGRDDSSIQFFVEYQAVDGNFVASKPLTIHENWVRGLDFTISGNDMLLAVSSQDATISLWKISAEDKEVNLPNDVALERDLVCKTSLPIASDSYFVYLEAILYGHEAWVYSVHWNPKDMTFISASLDKSMIIWEFNNESGAWLEKARVGEVGGGNLGFYGGMFGPNGRSILAHGYQGAFHIWNYLEEINSWLPAVTVGGHFNEVVDLDWEPHGEFIISVSKDQTTRVHAPWTYENQQTTWHEIARPQVHGFDMNCLAVISRYRFASGAEEKVIRTFNAPCNFVENFRRVCKITDDHDETEQGVQGAAVPSLGLSNKAVYEADNMARATAKSNKDPYAEESHFTAVELKEPPTEETLLQNTLWPEARKLYGHGYEIYSLAASPDGLLIASACKATTVEHAAIILWDTSTWKLTQKLASHSLTVVQMAFSPDSNHLISVSRDRRWTLFSRDPTTNSFEICATTDKRTGIHTRIIWCCAWSHDSLYFSTGSRDGKVVVWSKIPDAPVQGVLGQCRPVSQTLELKGESITALAFAPEKICGSYLVAVGLESGVIMLYGWVLQEWTLRFTLEKRVAHHLTVKRLAFRPVSGKAGEEENQSILQLASCGSDHAVIVYNLDLTNIV